LSHFTALSGACPRRRLPVEKRELDMSEYPVAIELDGGGRMFIIAESFGPQQVRRGSISAKLSDVTAPIEHISQQVLDAVRRAGPSKATLELGFGLAIESGQVVALLGKARSEATIKVTLEWSPEQSLQPENADEA
jgi:hypothetical protein